MNRLMQGIVAIVCVSALATAGCEKKPEVTATPGGSLDTMSTSTGAGTTTTTDPYAGSSSTYTTSPGATPTYTVTNVTPAGAASPATSIDSSAMTTTPTTVAPVEPVRSTTVVPEESLSAASDYNTSGPEGRTHVVKKGETLSSISRQYYGNPSDWKRIYDANRNRIKNRDQIRVGQRLIIP